MISISDIFVCSKYYAAKFLNSKNRKTLKAIFEDPIRSDIRWNDIENLVKDLGGNIKQGRGSRVMFELNGEIGRFHQPHPHPEIKKYVVKDFRDFLEEAGILPEE